jgi:histone-lysine N-methyltransferase SETMAR
VIRFLRLKGTSPAEIHRQVVEVYGANIMSRKHVWVWCTAFDNGRTDVQDEQRSGWPSTSTTDDNVCRIEGLIQENRRIRLSYIADERNISIGTVRNIVHEQLRYRKVCSRWVPKQLTEVYKSTRMGFSLVHLLRYHEEGVQFLQRIVTGDEMWVHHVTPERKQASTTSKHASSPPSKKFKTIQSTKKIMATVFWDHKGVFLVDFLTQGDTMNPDRY